MSVLTIRDGGTVLKDPSDISVYHMDWDTALQTSVTITTSTYAVLGLKGDITTTPLTTDQDAITVDNRHTQIRLTAGAAGSRWRVTNRIVTNETPAQTIERSFYVLLEER